MRFIRPRRRRLLLPTRFVSMPDILRAMRVGPFDGGLRRFVQKIEGLDRIRSGFGRFDSRRCDDALLNILRTIAEALVDGDADADRVAAQYAAIGAVAPSRREIDSENADVAIVDDIEAQLQAAQAGRGIARLLSYQVSAELAAGSLVRLLQQFEPEPLPVQLVTLSRSHMAPTVRAFLDSAVRIFQDVDVIR
jgi:DNA-binding transcriptional LysR family regulator